MMDIAFVITMMVLMALKLMDSSCNDNGQQRCPWLLEMMMTNIVDSGNTIDDER